MKSQRLIVQGLLFVLTIAMLAGCSPSTETPEINLTFDGETCQYEGPDVIPEGEVIIILNNRSEYELSLWAARLDEGRKWQDMLDYIGTPGSSVELPSWAEWRVIAAKVPDNPNASVYTLDEGLYAINCCTCGEVIGPRGVWPGAPLEVKEDNRSN
jgi:hypothetical protein